ncbi:membrane-bound lytic murein transglycosylase B [Bordetella ansorpii]|uniref:Membrane-bound lytic murein transglycosylase B n=1 Tax=Bordetella ansorpii TaxID=288768 RepID=A0A157SCF5_9BORD|nr:lytic murein transglycosylase B [Bordetella ansorpii]SAI68120.1 membrane-bound lytic murein transglycosylase B [Bordetella ansorpii]
MFICRRVLQFGMLAALAGCAASKPPATSASAAPLPAVQPATPQAGGATRIGPTEPPPEPSSVATPSGQLRPEVEAYARELAARNGLPLARVTASLNGSAYNATVARLIAPAPPGKKIWRSWNTYRGRFVEPKRIRWGVEFYQENQDLLNRAAQQYGVPAPIIAAIIGVETLYGRNMGNFRVMDALTTLAFDYPQPAKPERIQLFRDQLGDFIVLVLEGKLELETRGSFAGAIGMPQFMPGSIRNYAVDGDGDGHIDLANSRADAILSVGSFLAKHGWQRGAPVFAPVVLPADPSGLATGGLEPTQDWARLQAAGARLGPGAAPASWQSMPLGVVDLVEEARGTVQYRTGTPNFFALTQYNRSYFYATAVSDLADAIASQVRY